MFFEPIPSWIWGRWCHFYYWYQLSPKSKIVEWDPDPQSCKSRNLVACAKKHQHLSLPFGWSNIEHFLFLRLINILTVFIGRYKIVCSHTPKMKNRGSKKMISLRLPGGYCAIAQIILGNTKFWTKPSFRWYLHIEQILQTLEVA